MELEEGRLYTLPEVADITRLKLSNLRLWAASGAIRARKFGREYRMTADDIRYFIEHGTEEDPEK